MVDCLLGPVKGKKQLVDVLSWTKCSAYVNCWRLRCFFMVTKELLILLVLLESQVVKVRNKKGISPGDGATRYQNNKSRNQQKSEPTTNGYATIRVRNKQLQPLDKHEDLAILVV